MTPTQLITNLVQQVYNYLSRQKEKEKTLGTKFRYLLILF
jgi:hypothetical protein